MESATLFNKFKTNLDSKLIHFFLIHPDLYAEKQSLRIQCKHEIPKYIHYELQFTSLKPSLTPLSELDVHS